MDLTTDINFINLGPGKESTTDIEVGEFAIFI